MLRAPSSSARNAAVRPAVPRTASAQPSRLRERPRPGASALTSMPSVSTTRAADTVSADVHVGSARGVRFRATQDLAGHRCDLAATEQEEAQELLDRVALRPGEVDVGDRAGV